MKTKQSFCSSTIEGTKTIEWIRSSTIDDLTLLPETMETALRCTFSRIAFLIYLAVMYLFNKDLYPCAGLNVNHHLVASNGWTALDFARETGHSAVRQVRA
jgi:hypothetical protein